jgi:hypothetical protein
MTTTDTIPIDLTLAERHTLTDLLTSYIQEKALEAVQMAQYSIDLVEAADKTRRLAYLKALAEGDGSLLVDELDALRADLMLWALETEDTVNEHEEQIPEIDDETPRPLLERREAIADLRKTSAVDYAHKCVCEKIVSQIDAARELVPA